MDSGPAGAVRSLHTTVFFSPQSLCLTHTGKPTGVATSHCTTQFQTQLILTTCLIRPLGNSSNHPEATRKYRANFKNLKAN